MNSLMSAVSPSVTHMIQLDHAHVLATFQQFHAGTPRAKKQALVRTICIALEIHAQLEEEIFYPALRELASDTVMLEKSVPEHAEMRRLISALRGMRPEDAAYDSTFMELMRDVIHHVADEETTLLPAAELLLADRLGELGAEMTRRRVQLLAPRTGELASSAWHSMPQSGLLMAAGAVASGAYLFSRAASAGRRRFR
jgi:hemerythrin superfamily protein